MFHTLLHTTVTFLCVLSVNVFLILSAYSAAQFYIIPATAVSAEMFEID